MLICYKTKGAKSSILPLLFYKILNWNVAEYFLYFLTESVVMGLVLFVKSIFYSKAKELFVSVLGLFLYLSTCIILMSFFPEVGYGKNALNQLLHNFYILNWQFSLLPILLLQISNSIYSYGENFKLESSRQYASILFGRFIVYLVVVFPVIMLLNFTKSYIFLLIIPIIVRTLYELDEKIKLKANVLLVSPAKFIINFLMFVFLLIFVLAFINKNVRLADVVAGLWMLVFILMFRKSIYSMGDKKSAEDQIL